MLSHPFAYPDGIASWFTGLAHQSILS